MITITTTNTQLLNGLHEQDEKVWNEFVERYQPLLLSFGRRFGMSNQDAQDASQEILIKFCKAYQLGKYDRDKGRLRTWLSVIAKNQIRDLKRKRRDVVVANEDDQTAFMNAVPSPEDMDAVWEAEWQESILNQCMAEVRQRVEPKTMEAFEMFALQDMPAKEVAEKLGISENNVFVAKSRVLSHMRKVQEYLEENW